MILVADTVEAMTSDRPYRKAHASSTRCSRSCTRFSGTQFDPVCVRAMLALLEREGERFLRKDQKFDIYEFIEG